MRRSLAALLCLAGVVVNAAAPPVSPRIARVERWLKAVLTHEPGTSDDAFGAVAAWPMASVGALWVDLNSLVALMRNPRIARFDIRQPGQRVTQSIRYTPNDMHRLRILACAAAGLVQHQECLALKAGAETDGDLLRLARLAEASVRRGDANYVLRRGALLHTDVAMASPAATEPIEPPGSAAPQRLRLSLDDGFGKGLGQSAVHWEIARMLLDHVQPAGSDKADPAHDDMVRRWYRATAAWMQSRENYETLHLDRARGIFPDDPDILFLNGALHETYAAPHIQSAVHGVSLPSGMTFDLDSDHGEFRRAEGFLRRAVTLQPDFSEAHLRLGHVLLRLGKPADAVKELTQAIATSDDDLVRYYAALFSGAAREALGDFEAAAESYARAAELQPYAQSPHLALSSIARRRGDRSGALREIRLVFELASSSEDDDPWWTYHTAQARNADDLLAELIQPFLSGSDR
jgi:tetratricopeptide (TPR) repeat protein